jgi:hypothetical protein
MANNIKNLNDLGSDLLQVYEELRKGQIEPSVADSLANVAGKIIGAGKIMLEYGIQKGNSRIVMRKIPLLEPNSDQNVQVSDTTAADSSN